MSATSVEPQAESSGTSAIVVQTLLTQDATSRVPWQPRVSSQVGSDAYDDGQSAARTQQSPVAQQ